MKNEAMFYLGQIVEHKLFDYRGLIIDVDPYFMLTDDWYQLMAKSCPPKESPWYRVLVHNSNHETYVAEQNLAASINMEPINHPEIELYFDTLEGNKYQLKNNQAN